MYCPVSCFSHFPSFPVCSGARLRPSISTFLVFLHSWFVTIDPLFCWCHGESHFHLARICVGQSTLQRIGPLPSCKYNILFEFCFSFNFWSLFHVIFTFFFWLCMCACACACFFSLTTRQDVTYPFLYFLFLFYSRLNGLHKTKHPDWSVFPRQQKKKQNGRGKKRIALNWMLMVAYGAPCVCFCV